jgi:hypothetical protein
MGAVERPENIGVELVDHGPDTRRVRFPIDGRQVITSKLAQPPAGPLHVLGDMDRYVSIQ